jgi:hypothetical protein
MSTTLIRGVARASLTYDHMVIQGRHIHSPFVFWTFRYYWANESDFVIGFTQLNIPLDNTTYIDRQ